MIEFEKPTISKEIGEDGKYGKFTLQPLQRGYGTTLGNALRRILLASLPGAAVTSVKIEGILHEFSTIPGVREDVTEIILNLKNLALRLSGDDDEVIAVISAAVAMMAARDGKKYAVRSINRTENRRRSAGSVWGAAGQRENTLPF